VARFGDFLMRFRLAGPPGRAAPGGIPADRSAELAAELEPSLSLLDQAEAEARGVRERATRAAARRRAEAERQAEEIVASARARARTVRAESAERIRRTAEAEAAGVLASAESTAAAIRRLAQTRMPALVDRVAALVAEDLRTVRPPAGEGPGRRTREGSPPWVPGG
jgi:vacuolar-type H+-ATPase subunit H